MLSRRLLTLFVLAAGVSGYLFLIEHNRYFALPLGIAFALVIMVFVFQYQINWWWYSKFPPKLDASVEAMYARACTFYQGLTPADKQKFGTRAALFVEAKEWIGMGADKVAEDLKYIVACYAVMLTFCKKHFLFKGYDRIVFYLHPFLTPDFPNDVHTCEVEHTDGTIILSVEQLTAGFLSGGKYYEVGLHALAEAYKARYLTETMRFEDGIWDDLAEISGKTREEISEFVGLKQEDPWPVVVHHWFVHREGFERVLPELSQVLRGSFEGRERD